MKKRFLIILFTLIISVASVFPAYAGTSPRLVDNAGLLSSYEKQSLEAQIDKISEKYRFDVVIVTANTLGGKSAEDYAVDYYVDNGYGFSDSKDGIIFIFAMREREWFMMPFGYGNTAFTDNGLMSIEDRVIPYLPTPTTNTLSAPSPHCATDSYLKPKKVNRTAKQNHIRTLSPL